MSNENIEANKHSVPVSQSHQRPISSTEIILHRQHSDRERRYSAPPGERKLVRDSVGSIDYLSDGPGERKARNCMSDCSMIQCLNVRVTYMDMYGNLCTDTFLINHMIHFINDYKLSSSVL